MIRPRKATEIHARRSAFCSTVKRSLTNRSAIRRKRSGPAANRVCLGSDGCGLSGWRLPCRSDLRPASELQSESEAESSTRALPDLGMVWDTLEPQWLQINRGDKTLNLPMRPAVPEHDAPKNEPTLLQMHFLISYHSLLPLHVCYCHCLVRMLVSIAF